MGRLARTMRTTENRITSSDEKETRMAKGRKEKRKICGEILNVFLWGAF